MENRENVGVANLNHQAIFLSKFPIGIALIALQYPIVDIDAKTQRGMN